MDLNEKATGTKSFNLNKLPDTLTARNYRKQVTQLMRNEIDATSNQHEWNNIICLVG